MPLARGPSLESEQVTFRWLARLRWGAIAGQLVVIVIARQSLGLDLPLGPLAALLAAEVTFNLASELWIARRGAVRYTHLAAAMALDLLLFTGLLYLTGGPSNPFGFLYLIHIALAAAVLPARWSWGLVAFALACSAGLFLAHVPIGHVHHQHGDFDWHLRGMWVALGVAGSFIVYFLHRIMAALAQRDLELSQERERALRHERAASLAALAAGAAHELASPLNTIALVSDDLKTALGGSGSDQAALDVQLIRDQVARCRRILDQLAADSGQPMGEPLRRLTAREIAELALDDLPGRERVFVHPLHSPEALWHGPPRALAQATRNLLENALQASGEQRVELLLDAAGDQFRIEVVDFGTGMTAEVLERAREPFFSTKAGRGMGLGLFLAQSVADQLGGLLDLASEQGKGTRAKLVVPACSPGARVQSPLA